MEGQNLQNLGGDKVLPQVARLAGGEEALIHDARHAHRARQESLQNID